MVSLSTPHLVQARLEEIERDLAERIRTEDRGYQTPCWVWQRALISGYGDGWFDGIHMLAYRWTYQRFHGSLPPRHRQLDHLCRVRACCNPLHLEAVTRTENVRRGSKAKLTVDQVAEILLSTESYRALAKRFGVTHQTIAYYRSGDYEQRKARWA